MRLFNRSQVENRALYPRPEGRDFTAHLVKKYTVSPEVRQRALRIVLKSQDEYNSQWAAIGGSELFDSTMLLAHGETSRFFPLPVATAEVRIPHRFVTRQ
ncbi:IS1203 transposase orfA [Escherichia coli]|nr:hypothetical protein PU13_24955 [Escherichia coli]SQK58001.1 IS1203 transposase orfA [Escherichia coli]SQL85094.1 IS1203 transposase orfA [Escherichia coli]SQS28988.1 IS1203 transposase orfA [Escherichia coli]SQY60860.1 IS1203 transposase orfA [Escherichia coli]